MSTALKRNRQDILDSAKDRMAEITEDLTFCAGPADESWSDQRKQLWVTMQGRIVPAWARVLAPSMGAMVKASEQKAEAVQFNVLILGEGTVSIGEFEERAKKLEAIDATDVKVITKALAAADEELM